MGVTVIGVVSFPVVGVDMGAVVGVDIVCMIHILLHAEAPSVSVKSPVSLTSFL